MSLVTQPRLNLTNWPQTQAHFTDHELKDLGSQHTSVSVIAKPLYQHPMATGREIVFCKLNSKKKTSHIKK